MQTIGLSSTTVTRGNGASFTSGIRASVHLPSFLNLGPRFAFCNRKFCDQPYCRIAWACVRWIDPAQSRKFQRTVGVISAEGRKTLHAFRSARRLRRPHRCPCSGELGPVANSACEPLTPTRAAVDVELETNGRPCRPKQVCSCAEGCVSAEDSIAPHRPVHGRKCRPSSDGPNIKSDNFAFGR